MDSIPSFKANHLLPYLQFFRKIGAPTEHFMRQAKLPVELDYSGDAFIAMMPTLTFMTSMSRSQGIDDLTLRSLKEMQLEDLGESIATAITTSPSLLVALSQLPNLLRAEDDCVIFFPSASEELVRLNTTYAANLHPSLSPYQEWHEILLLITIVRAFAGKQWKPDEISLRSHARIGEFSKEIFEDTQFRLGQKACSITIPRHFLTLSPLHPSAPRNDDPETEKGPHKIPADSFPKSLQRIISAYLAGGQPGIQLAAELSDTSVRSMQRELSLHHMTYSDVVKQARQDLALQMLANPDNKIIEIAYQLGYRDPAHFSRAFKHSNGVSPRGYRSL